MNGSLFNVNFDKQIAVGIFQLAGYCGLYILQTFQVTTNQCLLKSRTQRRLNVTELMINGYLHFVHSIILFCKITMLKVIACMCWRSILNLHTISRNKDTAE